MKAGRTDVKMEPGRGRIEMNFGTRGSGLVSEAVHAVPREALSS